MASLAAELDAARLKIAALEKTKALLLAAREHTRRALDEAQQVRRA